MPAGTMHHAGPQLRQSTANKDCLLPEGLLRGTVEVLVNVRVSDFLRQQPGLVVLHDCRLTGYGEAPDSPNARKLRVALINVGRITGVSQWENKPV